MPDGGITALSGLQTHITQARASAAPPGDGIRHGVAFMPGGGCALPGL
ncbi:tripartite tricarboxylate transporter TctB, partial [Klebsiella variicola]